MVTYDLYTREKEEEQREEEFDTATLEQNVVDDSDYNSDALKSHVDFFLATVESEWNHGCTKRKAYKALDRALKIIEGKHAEQYTKLWDFAKEVKKTNPGSTVKKYVQGENFEGCFMVNGQNNNSSPLQKAMEDMKKPDEKAYNWLVKKPAHHWSKSHFETYLKCDMLLNNLCESFNVVILVPRQKPIVTMLLLIHILLMKRIQMRRDIMVNKVGDLCPKIKKKLEEAKIQSGRKYGLTRIPCNHAIAAINFKKKKPMDYVDAYYSKARYLEVYSHLVMLMNGMSLWEETENPLILPPTYTRQPGRLRRRRNKEAAEKDNEGEQTLTNPTNNLQGPPQPLKLGRKG
ncbi:uncharacterized protein [Malus domestica]|uniref:uncharacterized protein n=1 Tax=Malus domestica TaxID=3750 RepID=UPI003974719D